MFEKKQREICPLFFKDLRQKVIKDTEDEFNSGKLPWCYKTVRSLIAPFPRTGEMDEYREGQSDEGEPDCSMGKCWDDGISSDDDVRASCKRPFRACKTIAALAKTTLRARGPLTQLHLPKGSLLSLPTPIRRPTPHEAIAEVASSLLRDLYVAIGDTCMFTYVCA